MPEPVHGLLAQLAHAAQSYDRDGVDAACAALVCWAWQTSGPLPEAETVARAIREQRCWPALGLLSSALLARGDDQRMVRSCLIQSAIDGAELALAQGLLQPLLAKHPDDIELLGLEGRLHKQRFVRAVQEGAPHEVRSARLAQALHCYLRVYERTKASWHGINAVALAKRAQRDGLALTFAFDADAAARSILDAARAEIARGNRDAWSYALVLEAALALGMPSDALTGALGFASHPEIGAFSYAGTLRQLREIWAVDESDLTMRTITGLLEAKIVALHGGASVVLRNDCPALPCKSSVREQVQNALERAEPELRQAIEQPRGLERTFEGTLVAFDSLLAGIACCDAVAWLEHARSRHRVGTGFLIAGERLGAGLGAGPLLVTNAHVLDRNAASGALEPGNAAVYFQQGPNKGHRFSVREVLWVSPERELDVCIAALHECPTAGLDALASRLPAQDARSFVYVIGHAGGGTLSFSLMDNLLLDYDDRVLHYRSPTEPGSSGSPVFDLDWQLVGVHHSGLDQMPRLHGRGGTYAANEGTRFDVVRAAIGRSGARDT